MLFKPGWVYAAVISLILISCNQNPRNRFDSPEDSLQFQTDSLTDIAGACQGSFFRDLERFEDSSSAYLIVDSNKRITLTQFFRDEFMSPVSSYGLKDLDEDGAEELIVYNNTGGAHCCDEFSIFSAVSENEYMFKSRLMGDVCITPETNAFTFSFNEPMGYFFSCYACNFSDSSSSFRTMRALRMRYAKGKLEVIPYSKQEEVQNLRNFEVLTNSGYKKLNGLMDDGWRKEYAVNTAIWHFNHGKNWTTTKTLFDKYYQYPDHKQVWDELYQTILATSHENTF
jgi:hypothetical protein